jgi:hypothetical protein
LGVHHRGVRFLKTPQSFYASLFDLHWDGQGWVGSNEKVTRKNGATMVIC